jgi:hypothetical protein
MMDEARARLADKQEDHPKDSDKKLENAPAAD